jgi:hypothetical protein
LEIEDVWFQFDKVVKVVGLRFRDVIVLENFLRLLKKFWVGFWRDSFCIDDFSKFWLIKNLGFFGLLVGFYSFAWGCG